MWNEKFAPYTKNFPQYYRVYLALKSGLCFYQEDQENFLKTYEEYKSFVKQHPELDNYGKSTIEMVHAYFDKDYEKALQIINDDKIDFDAIKKSDLRTRIYLRMGRIDDVINFGGIKVAPEEIEHEVGTNPIVRDCACVALKDEISGQIPVLCIALDSLMETAFHLPYWPSYLTALILSVLWNFTFNRRYTFRSDANVPRAMALVALFYLVFTPLSGWWGKALTDLGWNEDLVMIGTMLINFVTEFLYQKFVVYRGMIDTNDVAKRAMEKEAGTPAE